MGFPGRAAPGRREKGVDMLAHWWYSDSASTSTRGGRYMLSDVEIRAGIELLQRVISRRGAAAALELLRRNPEAADMLALAWEEDPSLDWGEADHVMSEYVYERAAS